MLGGNCRCCGLLRRKCSQRYSKSIRVLRQQYHESRMRHEGERPRRLMLDVHLRMIELTAQILVVCDMDPGGKGVGVDRA
jgi:hypothetical protein